MDKKDFDEISYSADISLILPGFPVNSYTHALVLSQNTETTPF